MQTEQINKETLEWNDTTDQKGLTDFYRVCHPATAQYTFLEACGTFSKISHILAHKASINKYKKIEIIPCVLSDSKGIKLELDKKRNRRKYSNTWKLNNTLMHDQ
jgi:hypothetical protein